MPIRTQNKGVCMHLNAGLAYTNTGYANIGLKFFYWGRWVWEAALNFNNSKIKPNMSDMRKI
jgi:hypothetical protein